MDTLLALSNWSTWPETPNEIPH